MRAARASDGAGRASARGPTRSPPRAFAALRGGEREASPRAAATHWGGCVRAAHRAPPAARPAVRNPATRRPLLRFRERRSVVPVAWRCAASAPGRAARAAGGRLRRRATSGALPRDSPPRTPAASASAPRRARPRSDGPAWRARRRAHAPGRDPLPVCVRNRSRGGAVPRSGATGSCWARDPPDARPPRACAAPGCRARGSRRVATRRPRALRSRRAGDPSRPAASAPGRNSRRADPRAAARPLRWGSAWGCLVLRASWRATAPHAPCCAAAAATARATRSDSP